MQPRNCQRLALLAAAAKAYDRAFGLDAQLITCPDCHATWHGRPVDNRPCGWCADAAESQRRDARKELLWPSWLLTDQGYRYHELSEIDQAVWRRTRGLDADAAAGYLGQLARAAETGLITNAEANAALARFDQAK